MTPDDMTRLYILISRVETLGEQDAGPTLKLQVRPRLSATIISRPPKKPLIEHHCFLSRQYIVRRLISLHLCSTKRTLIRRLWPWNQHLPSGKLFPFLQDVDSLPFEGAVSLHPRRSKIMKKLFPLFLHPQRNCFTSSPKK